VECRINAEDPFAGWMPSPGTIRGLRAAEGPWVRNDTGVYEGYTVPRFYDTLLAKLVVWGADRDAALARMARALAEYRVVGVRTTLPVLQRVIESEEFRAGRLSTSLLDALMLRLRPESGRHRSVAVIAAVLEAYRRSGLTAAPSAATATPALWRLGARTDWRGRGNV
jgi:acetyl-CoA carboxylase biotin carboxylase subunit